jgi:ABC-type uncharacterized transport system auxiliary subunit
MTACSRFFPRGVLLALALALALGACAQAPVPSDTFYRLGVHSAAVPPSLQPVFDVAVEVRPFDADGILAERALVYVTADAGSLGQYSYHFWVEPPAQAVQRELTDHLRRSGRFGEVVTSRFRVRSDVAVLGRIGRLEQVLKAEGTAGVVVELEIGAERTGREGGLLTLNTYRVESPANDASPAAAVAAMRTALLEIFERFTADLIRSLGSP